MHLYVVVELPFIRIRIWKNQLDRDELFVAYKKALLLVMDLQSHIIEQYNLKVTRDFLERLLNYIKE